jgi:hypothetical protein
MALLKGWRKHLRGSTCVALGHAKRLGHPALPFWATGPLSPTLIVVDWPHTSLDQIKNKFFLNIKINNSYNNKIATRLSGTVILHGSNLVPTTSIIMPLAATPNALGWSWIIS